jgi:HEAT repeat protein
MRTLLAFGVIGLFLGAAPLARASSKEDDAKKYLADLQTAKDPKVKGTAAEELGKLGQVKASYGRPAIPYLLEALKDKDEGVRAKAAKALGQVDPEPADALDPLIDLVKNDKSIAVRKGAVEGLASMGANAKDAVPTLRELAQMNKDKKGPERQLSQSANQALRVIMERTKK